MLETKNKTKFLSFLYVAFAAILLFFSTSARLSGADPTWMVDTSWTLNKHIRTAAICYGANNNLDVMGFVGRHYDLVINVGNNEETAGNPQDTLKLYNSNIKNIRYIQLNAARMFTYQGNSYGHDNDSMDIDSFYTNRGWDDSTAFLWTTDSVVVEGFGFGGYTPDTFYIGAGNKLQSSLWGSPRACLDYREDATNAYLRWKFFHQTDSGWTGGPYDGVMEDEAAYYYGTGTPMYPFNDNGTSDNWLYGDWLDIQDWSGSGLTHQQVGDSLSILMYNSATNTGWAKDLADTAYAQEKMWLRNIVTSSLSPGQNDSWYMVKGAGAGALLIENGLEVLSSAYNGLSIWRAMDSIIAWDTAYAVIWTTIRERDTTYLSDAPTESGLDRSQMYQLSYYYMGVIPDRFFLMIQGNDPNHLPNSYQDQDSLWNWFGALEYDVGFPDSARYIDTSGTDGASQTFNIYRRDYTRSDGRDVIIFSRLNWSWNYAAYEYGASTAVPIALGGTYQQLYADSSLGTATETASIRNVEGLIFISTNTDDPGVEPDDDTLAVIIDTIPPAPIFDLEVSTLPENNSGLNNPLNLIFNGNDIVSYAVIFNNNRRNFANIEY